MPVSVSTIAKTRNLTTLRKVKEVIGISVPTYDDILEDLIAEASSAIESHCSRVFARQTYSETMPGYGDLELQLHEAPLISVSSVLLDSSAITDYSVGDRDQGYLYREGGWGWTVQTIPGLSGHQTWPSIGTPQPNLREPRYTVVYVAGYILPGQWLHNVGTLSAASADNSFNDSNSGFPSNVAAGDVIVTSGFANAANNGRFLVSSATTAKIVVDATLTVEAATANNSAKFPGHAAVRPFDEVERAALDTVKTWWLSRTTAGGVVEKQARGVRLRFSESIGSYSGVSPQAAAILRRWQRVR